MLVSYAQNFEDVMLWRALRHVENGFYIDIGAQDPIVDSVSLVFHERGWEGIHIEPTPHYAQLLRENRPGDTVIQAAVGGNAEVLPFFEIPGTGISTADSEIAEQHRDRGFEIRQITVPSIRLSSVFATCQKRDVHWMKIDVEGFEFGVLSSWGKSTARPWIVVVESTLPLTQIESYKRWEPLLLRRGYQPVYFDGLNRYYVCQTKAELKQAFRSPPNVFDDFAVSGTASTQLHSLIKSKFECELAKVTSESQKQILRATSEIDQLKASVLVREIEVGTQVQAFASQVETHKEEFASLERTKADREVAMGTEKIELHRQLQELSHKFAERERQVAQEQIEREREHFVRQASLINEAERKVELARRDAQSEMKELLSQRDAEFLRQVQELSLRVETQAQAARSQELAAEGTRREWMVAQSEIARLTKEVELGNVERVQAGQAFVIKEQSLSSEISTLRKQIESLSSANRDNLHEIVNLRADLAEREVKMRELSEVLSASQQMLAQESAARAVEQEEAQRVKAKSARIELDRTKLIEDMKARDATIVGLKLECRQLRDHLAKASGELTNARNELRQKEQDFQMFADRLTAEMTSLHVSLFSQEKTKQKWLLSKSARSSGWKMHDRFALVAPVLAIREMVRHNFYPGNEKEERMSEQRYVRAAFQPSFVMNASNVYHLDDFLLLHDEAFVNACYRALLKRDPDPDGMKFYVYRVRTGLSKAQIVEEICNSEEARQKGVQVQGLREATRFRQRCELPVLGRVFATFSFLKNLQSHLQDLRALENHLFRSSEQMQSLVEINLDRLHSKITEERKK
jgi:FkbM family methyltransferase